MWESFEQETQNERGYITIVTIGDNETLAHSLSSPSSSSSHNSPAMRSQTRHLAPAASLLARNTSQLLFSLSFSLCGCRLPGHPSDRSDHLDRPKLCSSLMHPCYYLCGWLRAPQTRARFSGYPSRRRGSSDGAPPPWVLPHSRAPLWRGPSSLPVLIGLRRSRNLPISLTFVAFPSLAAAVVASDLKHDARKLGVNFSMLFVGFLVVELLVTSSNSTSIVDSVIVLWISNFLILLHCMQPWAPSITDFWPLDWLFKAQKSLWDRNGIFRCLCPRN